MYFDTKPSKHLNDVKLKPKQIIDREINSEELTTNGMSEDLFKSAKRVNKLFSFGVQ